MKKIELRPGPINEMPELIVKKISQSEVRVMAGETGRQRKQMKIRMCFWISEIDDVLENQPLPGGVPNAQRGRKADKSLTRLRATHGDIHGYDDKLHGDRDSFHFRENVIPRFHGRGSGCEVFRFQGFQSRKGLREGAPGRLNRVGYFFRKSRYIPSS